MNPGASLGADRAVADIAGGYGSFAAPTPMSPPRLSLLPMDSCREVWQALAHRCPQSSIYHELEWQRVLHSAYGLNFQAAVLEQDDYGPIAGCVFARARNPFSRRLIALPFSDYCAPLEVETGGCAALLEALAARLSVAGEACELRGATAPAPWVVDDRFRHWKLDLGVGVKAVEQAMDRNFRRQIRRAREAGITVSYGASTDYARRFYRLHLENRRRLGLPAPPWRFFRLVAEILGASGRFEVWLARRRWPRTGQRRLAEAPRHASLQVERARRDGAGGHDATAVRRYLRPLCGQVLQRSTSAEPTLTMMD